MNRIAWLIAAVAAATPAAAQNGVPQNWPERPIRLIVPFTAGSSSDIVARIVAQKLGERLKQQLVVDNRVGASGNMGTEGSVAFQFKHCGQIVFAPGTSEDKVMEVALESGADDVVAGDDGSIEVLTPPADFEAVKNALEAAGLKPEVAEVTMRAENPIELAGEDAARMQKLLDVIEDLDDVQDLYHNALLDA